MPMSNVQNFLNPNLRWEKIGMLNTGVDFRTRNNVFIGSVEYYIKKGQDLYGEVPIDYTAGLGTELVVKNVASLKGDGWDIQLEASIIRKKKFRWSAVLNLNYYRDKVVSYYQPVDIGSSYITGSGLISTTPIEGKPVYSMLSYKWAGLSSDNGDPQGYLGQEKSTDYFALTGSGTKVTDLIYSGHVMPKWNGSFGTSFSYGGFTITARFTFKFNYYFRKTSIGYASLYTGYSGHNDFEKRWKATGDEANTDVPSMSYPANQSRDAFYLGSEALVRRGDHLRFQYINLSYNLEEGFLRKVKIESMNLFINSNNLGIIWRRNKEKIDPDFSDNAILLSKTFSIGARIIF